MVPTTIRAPRIRDALRTGLIMGISLGAVLLVLSIGLLVPKEDGTALMVWPFLATQSFVFGINAILATWFGSRAARNFLLRQWSMVAWEILAGALGFGLSTVLLYAVASWDWFARIGWIYALASVPAAACVYFLACWQHSRELSQREPWESLDLAD